MNTSQSLAYFNTGAAVAPRVDRQTVRRNKSVYDEVQQAAFMSDGVMDLAAHIMDGALGLNAMRQALSTNDPIANAVLAETQYNAMRRVAAIQSKLYSGWSHR